MIDMHNHVLYGVDDGSPSIEESIRMLTTAKEVGFSGIVLTPHYMCYQNFVSPVKENEKRTAVLREVADRVGLEIDLWLGSELLFEYKLKALVGTGQFKTLGDSPCFLIETVRHGGTATGVMNFMQYLKSQGYQTVFAHPERYDFVQDDINVILDFLEKGTLIQCNYLTLTGYYGEKSKITLERMLEHQMVQLMGSDAHQEEGYALYPEAKERGIRLIGAENWEGIMCTNPERLLANQGGIRINPRQYKKKVTSSVIGSPSI